MNSPMNNNIVLGKPALFSMLWAPSRARRKPPFEPESKVWKAVFKTGLGIIVLHALAAMFISMEVLWHWSESPGADCVVTKFFNLAFPWLS